MTDKQGGLEAEQTLDEKLKLAEIERREQEAEKFRQERLRIQDERTRERSESKLPWIKKASTWKVLGSIVLSVSILGFYISNVIVPASNIKNEKLALENAKKSRVLDTLEQSILRRDSQLDDIRENLKEKEDEVLALGLQNTETRLILDSALQNIDFLKCEKLDTVKALKTYRSILKDKENQIIQFQRENFKLNKKLRVANHLSILNRRNNLIKYDPDKAITATMSAPVKYQNKKHRLGSFVYFAGHKNIDVYKVGDSTIFIHNGSQSILSWCTSARIPTKIKEREALCLVLPPGGYAGIHSWEFDILATYDFACIMGEPLSFRMDINPNIDIFFKEKRLINFDKMNSGFFTIHK